MSKGDPEVALAGGGSTSANAAQPERSTTQSRSTQNTRSGEASILKPLGLGSTGRTLAKNLTEKLAMEEIMSNPSIGRIVKVGLKDQRWSGWSKMSNRTAHGIEIHYVGKWENGILAAVDDFKFVGD